MDPACYGSLQVCAARLALLQPNGVPLAGADNGYVTEGVVSVDVGIERTEGDDLEKKNGCGRPCQTFRGDDVFKRANLGFAGCELDIQLGSLMVGGHIFLASAAADAPFGWRFPASTDTLPIVSFEFWTKAWATSVQASPDSTGGDVAYWHWVFTSTRWSLDDMTAENDFLEFALTGFGEENPNMPAAGPFGDWPDDIADDGGFNTIGGMFLDANLPTQTCGFIEVPAVAS